MLIHVQSSNIPIVRKPIANANCTSLLSTLLPAWKQWSVFVSCSRPNLMTFTNCTPYSSQRCTGVCSIIWWQSLIKTRPASRLRVQTNGAQLPWLQSPLSPLLRFITQWGRLQWRRKIRSAICNATNAEQTVTYKNIPNHYTHMSLYTSTSYFSSTRHV
jgi:hypothetical protein